MLIRELEDPDELVLCQAYRQLLPQLLEVYRANTDMYWDNVRYM